MPSNGIGGSGKVALWRRWFAWRPVRLIDGSRTVWLCWVFRRVPLHRDGGHRWDYTDRPDLHPAGPVDSSHWL